MSGNGDIEAVIMDSIKDLPGREIEEGTGERPEGAIEDREPESEGVDAPVESDDATEGAEGLAEGDKEPTKKLKPTTKAPEDEPVKKPAEKKAEKPEKDDEEPEEDDEEAETPEKQKDGRQNRMPYDRHVKIVDNSNSKLFKSITGEDAPRTKEGRFDSEAATTKIKASIEERDTEITSLRAHKEQVSNVEHVMINEPEQFLELLPHLNPKYAEILGAAKQARTAMENADRPQPDIELTDGRRVYSDEQAAKLDAWRDAKAEAKAQALIDKNLGPMKKQAAAESELGQRQKFVQQTLSDAREGMEGFKENETAIFEVMQSSRIAAEKAGKRNTMTLDKAWVKVMLPIWKKEKQAQWEEWTAEQKGKKTGTSVIANTPIPKKGETIPNNGDDPVTAAIKKSIAGLKR